ncbi:tetratricopeptide repeat protein [Flagellimonas meridianipacifica]|uniref:Tetratricopeptide repeat protein n=1 Tax=Flagellimonas meridianipacifica TaxID=1080225 RepID=A0A2T0MI00_9FLAO|nr:tetratricopeptide repeat protein [Allomuricauda pacifica]PRX57203.1 tetratricopeptide repeat protein [Allomuricauda pacifica]
MSKYTPELFDLIEAYLSDSLDPTSKLEFEESLRRDPGLQEALEKHRTLHESMSNMDAVDFRKKLIKIEGELSDVKTKRLKGSWFNWQVAATVLVIISLGAFFLYQNATQEQLLFDTYFTVYPLDDVVRGNEEAHVKLAYENYAKEDYEGAIPALEKLIAETPGKHHLRMYLGNAYLKQGEVQKALGEFKQLTKVPAYEEQANWYMALCYLKIDDKDKTILLLKDLIAYDGIYKSKAKDLYDDLLKQKSPDDF